MASASVHGNMAGHGHGPTSMGSISTAPGLSLAVMLQQTAYNGIINCFCHGHASKTVQLPFHLFNHQHCVLRILIRLQSVPVPPRSRLQLRIVRPRRPAQALVHLLRLPSPKKAHRHNLLQTSCPSISLAPRLGCHTNSLLMLHPASITILDAHSSASSSTILRPRFSSRPSPSSRPADDSRPHRPMIHQ